MSLTNPNKVITEERLSEFYQSIFPYLGGMPEILANKFNKSDLYSTSEKMIGQWIDGKPLYQKTFSTTTPSIINTYVTIADLTSLNISIVCDLEAIIKVGSNLYKKVSNYNSAASSAVWVSGTNLRCCVILDEEKSQTIYVTIQYTKTTDSLVSVGNDTDYSTTEKIVGTWIDGKPVYQKTFVDIITVNSSNLNISYPHNISNIDAVVGCYGVYRNTDNTSKATIPIMWDGQSAVISANRTNISLLRTSDNFIQNCVVSATIQYTKTTD